MSALQSFIHRVLQPTDRITDSLERQRAYTLSVLFGILLLSSFVGGLLFILFDPAIQPDTLTLIILGNLMYIGLITLSRTIHYRISAWLLVIGITAILWGGYFLDFYESPQSALMYLVGPIIVASLVMTSLQTLLAFVFILLTLIIFPIINPNPNYNPYNLPVFLSGVGILTFAWVYLSNRFSEQLKASQQRYRELMNANDEAILVVDYHDAHILDYNPAFKRIIGYTDEEIMGRFPTDFLTPESAKLSKKYWEDRSGIPHQLKGIRQDGSNFFVRSTIKPYTFREEPAYVVTFQDISQQHAAETALRLSEERFEAIFHNTFQFISVLDTHGRIEGMNEPTMRFGDYQLKTVRGSYIWRLNWYKDDESRKLVESKIREASAGHFTRFEVDLVSSEGITITVDVSLKPITNEETVSMLIMEARDITDRKREERKRLEYQHRYQALFNHTVDAVFIIDISTGKPIAANEQALRMLRCTMQDIISAELTSFIVEEEHTETFSVLEQLRSGVEITSAYERKMRRKDGEIFIAEITAMRVRDADGHPQYIQSMIRDTTERRESQQRDFELALNRERVQILENFITQASHHFRTPITSMRISTHILPKYHGNEEKQQEHYEVLQKELKRLENLLNDLLMVSRLQRDEEEYYISRMLMSQFIAEFRTGIESKSSYSQHKWSWDVQWENDTIVVGDKQRLTRAMTNIFDNAMSYTPENGTIDVRCYKHNSWAVIEVEDTGIGMSDLELRQVFDDFYRAPAARELDSTSTGLGLSITEKIVDRHKGTVRVASVLDKGTVVQVILPVLLDWNTPPPPAPFDIYPSNTKSQHT